MRPSVSIAPHQHRCVGLDHDAECTPLAHEFHGATEVALGVCENGHATRTQNPSQLVRGAARETTTRKLHQHRTRVREPELWRREIDTRCVEHDLPSEQQLQVARSMSA